MVPDKALIDAKSVQLKVLIVDASNGFYRVQRYPLGLFSGL